MPPKRAALSEISGNTQRGPNLTPEERLTIIAKSRAGVSTMELAQEFNRDASTIRRTLYRAAKHNTIYDLPRPGRPKVISEHQRRIIWRLVRKSPKVTYKVLQEAATIIQPDGTALRPPGRNTIWRMLRKMGLARYRCRKRPRLEYQHAQERLKWCRRFRYFPWSNHTVRFSDECSVEKGKGQKQEWCFRYKHEKWNQKMITPIATSTQRSQMVWASIWLNNRGQPCRSPLVIMERDTTARKYGYTAKSYIKALEIGLLPSWRPGQRFMHDNAPIHQAHIAKEWLTSHGITVILWPPYSPDLNPIEHLWGRLKQIMFHEFPEYNAFSNVRTNWAGFCEALKEAWLLIPPAVIRSLIMSMPRRISAVRRAKGWQTRY